jgi:8-oxo-dGTP pyrophosphatase MutT (NUDIX family)
MSELLEKFYYRDPTAPKPNVPLQPGVAAVIYDEAHRILLMKRPRGPYWSIPGGRMDAGESAPACCIREVEEETGLNVRVLRLIGLYTDPQSICAYPDGNVHQSYIALFECEQVGGELRTSEESERFRWIGREELDTLHVLPDTALCCVDAWANQTAAFIR